MNPLQSGIKIPVNCTYFLENLQFERCSVEESIAWHVRLLLTTSFDECKFDREFGCQIWDHEFEHSQINRNWIDRMALQMQTALGKYEQRLTGIIVKATVSDEELKHEEDGRDFFRLQKCLHVKVTGHLRSTNVPFYANEKIFLSPFAME